MPASTEALSVEGTRETLQEKRAWLPCSEAISVESCRGPGCPGAQRLRGPQLPQRPPAVVLGSPQCQWPAASPSSPLVSRLSPTTHVPMSSFPQHTAGLISSKFHQCGIVATCLTFRSHRVFSLKGLHLSPWSVGCNRYSIT